MRFYFYLNGKNFIRVMAENKPSVKTQPRSGTWIIREFISGKGFALPTFPEIVFNTLKKFEYLGSKPA